MKGSKRKYNWSDTKIGMIIMKMKKLATAIEMAKGTQMDIDDIQYRWVEDRIKMLEEKTRKLTQKEMSTANEMWTMYGK